MKAKIIMEMEEDFLDFVMREGNLGSAGELKGFLLGIYTSAVDKEKGVKSVEIEVTDEN